MGMGAALARIQVVGGALAVVLCDIVILIPSFPRYNFIIHVVMPSLTSSDVMSTNGGRRRVVMSSLISDDGPAQPHPTSSPLH